MHLVTAPVRPAMRPPLRRGGILRLGKRVGGDAPDVTHDRVHGALKRVGIARVVGVPRREFVSVAEETAAGLVVPVLVPKFTLGAKL